METHRRTAWVIASAATMFLPFLTERPASPAAPATGPRSEKRFPPLKVPAGFKTTLFACDPLVEYPSVIARGPKPGTLFVAHDYVTGLGIEIVKRDEVRLLRDTNGDGYADESTLFAGGFNSIQGLAFDNGTVFVMHAPLLTALKDTNGDGVADVRRDLLKGLGLPPEKNPNRLHSANGVVAGHDGWLYLALGDRGCDVRRPEGDRLLFRQGGILRCRPDGRDLHVFAGGLRNIYDVVLDEEQNVFVRDNENDGGNYMIRVCRSFFGADHGYPYLYDERPREALPPLADLGRGSSAGGVSYMETAFPQEFRESLFFCEWGRAIVRYRKTRAGSHFARMKESDFAAGAPNDPYGFKPTDLVVDFDGSLLVSDWADGQRPKRGRGRIYRIAYAGNDARRTSRMSVSGTSKPPTLFAALNSPSYTSRVAAQRELERRGERVVLAVKAVLKAGRLNSLGRMHAVWVLAHLRGTNAVNDVFAVAKNDADPRVRAQAVRALGDLTDPVLLRHRLSAGSGDEKIAARFATLVSPRQDPRIVLEVLVALGRLRCSAAPRWLSKHWDSIPLDPSVEHAAMQLLRRSGNGPAVLKLLDLPSPGSAKLISHYAAQRTGLRTIALRALADRAEPVIVDGLIRRLASERRFARRRDYIDALARVYKKRGAWTYWGFRPAPRPANTVAWERTEAIRKAIDGALADGEFTVRMTALQRMRREEIPISLSSLLRWQRKETRPEGHAAILDALSTFPPATVRDAFERVLTSRTRTTKSRLLALRAFVRGLDAGSQQRLLHVARTIEDGPVAAAVLRELGRRKTINCNDLILKKLSSKEADVRAAAIAALAERRASSATRYIARLLADSNVEVRRAAAAAAGILRAQSAAGTLRKLASSTDRTLCRASLISLRQLGQPGAVSQAVAALKRPDTQLAALEYLERFGNARQTDAVVQLAATSRSTDVAIAIVRTLSRWSLASPDNSPDQNEVKRAIAIVHRRSGMLLRWSVSGPHSADAATRILKGLASRSSGRLPAASNRIGEGADGAITLSREASTAKPGTRTWLAVSEVAADKSADVEFLVSAAGALRVWLNGKPVFRRSKPAAYQPDSDRFRAKLLKGVNRIAVRIDASQPRAVFHLRFRTKSSKAEHERLVTLALNGRGSALRGREVFHNVEKSQCLKCHRMGDKGGRIGPDLTGIGRRFSKIHLVESILDPSRTIAPSYATYSVVLTSGKVYSGVKFAETATTITLGDKDGKTHDIRRSEIDLIRRQPKSIMPDGLEKRLADREFVDLVAFLLSQKGRRSER